MKLFVLLALTSACCFSYASGLSHAPRSKSVRKDRLEVLNYLVEYGYLESLHFKKYELRRALRHLQVENNLVVNGRINRETKKFVRDEKNKKMVIEYLKNYNYLLGRVTPLKLIEAIKLLQRNSGFLTVTGSIDTPTIDFVETNQQYGYSEGLTPPESFDEESR